MATTTASVLIRGAFETIGVLGEGQTLDASKGADGFRRLNLMLRSWSLQNLTIPVTVREVFDLVTDQGGPDNPYTIGDGGDFDTDRPPTQNSLVGAGLILTSSDPTVEIPRAIYTDTMYQQTQIKDLASGGSGVPTGVYYNPTYPLGKIYLWPVPSSDENDLALYLRKPLSAFASQTVEVDLPDGSEEAIEYNLAVRLCGPYSVPVDSDVKAMAKMSLGMLKRANYHLYDLTQDPAFARSHAAYYNIVTGGNG